MLISWQVLINEILQINGFLLLWKNLKKWLKTLSIYLKCVNILRVLNFSSIMRENYFNKERSSPSRSQFSKEKCNLELYKRTFWDGSKDFLKFCLSWKTFILSLQILDFSYASCRISPNSFNCNFLNELALSKLNSNNFIA